MCKCLKVSKSAYYRWLKNQTKTKVNSTTIYLRERIKELFTSNRKIYGSYRIQKLLSKEGMNYSRSYIARLMRQMKLRSIHRKKYRITTDSTHKLPIVKNILNRDFKANRLGAKWVSDITYIPLAGKWSYLTTIIDLADRKVIGWSLSKDLHTENTIYKAWIKARANRELADKLIFHSDRGIQYASKKMQLLFGNNTKIVQSMSRKGNCWDNAVAESFFKSIKTEHLNHYSFSCFNKLYNSIEAYIYWYNNYRLHSALGYKSPAEKELELSSN